MIKLLFKHKGFSEQDFEEKNLSILMHDEKLKELNISAIDISNAIDTSYMFNGCYK